MNIETLTDLRNLQVNAGWYETHITVSCKLSEVEDFKELCKEINLKVIVIDLQNGENQIMTSKTSKVTALELYNGTVRDLRALSEHFPVLRVKIECSPFNEVLKSVGSKYIESHIPCVNISSQVIKSLDLNHNYHVSKNYFKENIKLVTVRVSNMGYEGFKKSLDLDIKLLKDRELLCEPYVEDIEFCIYDDNPNIDNNWMLAS